MKNNAAFSFLILFIFVTVRALAQPVVITPPSANIEPGESVTLTASGAMYYMWSPATGLSTTEGPVTVASPAVTTTYTCSGYAPGDESVVNGNFDQGNFGFTSAYIYTNDLMPEGTYCVGSNAQTFHSDFVGTGHGGSGNFMVINGSTTPNTNVWTEQITVNPNTYYSFSTWVCTVSPAGDVARLQFSINGNQLGDVFSAPDYTGQWLQFYELWYSGNNTAATITILNQNTSGSGNDFGLDDISFCEIVLVGDPQCTVTVNNLNASANADDYELCEGESTTLHALPTGGSGNYTYSWTPANTLDDPSSQNPVATPPTGSTTYNCHISDGVGTVDVRVTVNVFRTYEIQLSENICPNEVYDFFGEELHESGQYEHLFHTSHGCDSLFKLDLNVYPANDTMLVDPTICIGQTYNFHGTLYDQDGQIAYFDTIDQHGCLNVEMLYLTVGQYQVQPVEMQFECYEQGTTPAWTWDKTGITYHEDTYDEIVVDDPYGGCPIKYRLDLKFHEEYYHEESKMACESYTWPVTGETYYESQDPIVKTYHNDFGDKTCDSTFVLHLEISNYETNDFTIEGDDRCDGYFWDPQGKSYTTEDLFDPTDHYFTESGEYHRTYSNIQGCDSIVTMYAEFDYSPDPTDIFPVDDSLVSPHWVIAATEFQINYYDYTFWDNNELCQWDSVRWEFETPNMEWYLEPDSTTYPVGKTCRLYVLDYMEDTIWLRATAYNHCKIQGVSRRYWLLCSFYDVDEHQAEVQVYPNPSQGQVTVEAEGIERIRVVDMLGQVVGYETYEKADRAVMHLHHLPPAVYMLEIKTGMGLVMNRIIVTR